MANRLVTTQPIGVLGAGTMGIGIAQVAAQTGYTVRLFDLSDDVLGKALAKLRVALEKLEQKGKLAAGETELVLGRILPTSTLDSLSDVALVIEAAPEKIELKRSIFAQLEGICPPDAVLASNTSSIPITAIAGGVKTPERVVGLHFFNPVPLMKLVEVISGMHTSAETVAWADAFATSLGKTTAKCIDTPGFIVNRVARGYYGEGLRLVQEGVATMEQIDKLARLEGNFRMGPFELMDLIGIDVNLSVSQSVYQATYEEQRYRPNPIQERMVQAGDFGRKTGRGFYRYDQ
ncbi:3-hydroxyacyl-CoA dehydrogenase NAD-binding domain-containing protein [Tumebacillus permanentifrigoris]|uniref:3-hydroxybutyryl-CoA dehydrogenase n=1 Tax=Tumebacillus permanentifrigoris TaxID=378543 RepID=A0A316D347_9BACL|nr:3-hydroxyacyl-CoA dehydrogenase NAD-binding domain-containing protein [Tumebacillus permanentifrigoris]PWK05412.1 3-hydroxybutyryl-CoA dehydrogenase [Tumebacillus permanentifrigoris]